MLSYADEDQDDTLDALIEGERDDSPLASPDHHTRIIILTSGTTGTPKGAPRNEAGIDAAISLLSRMPLRQGWTVHIAAPLFHTWGFAHMMLSLLLGHTMVLRRKFDPEAALEAADDHKCDGMVVIPVMLQRILALPDETLDKYSLTSVKCVAASGSALPGDLAIAWMDHFGDNLYNTYGSTEVAYASIATPADMRQEPSTAGKPPWATVVKIFDEKGKEVPQGESGRIFVGNSLLFEGYTGGGHKDMIDGLMSSGDVGRFDEDGLLYVEGRDDEMIVSGGENVFPKEVEDCLARHDAVVEVAAIGVPDDEYGKRLRAFVVFRDGMAASEDDLKGHVKANLARFKVPREIVVLDELPRNATGKVLKRELTEWDGDEVTGPEPGLSLGTVAPDFTLRDQFGQDVTLSSYRGEKAVAIVFYPYAFSGVCTGEMAGLRDRLADLMTFGSEVLAISCDPVYSLRAFADADGLNFPLLSDFWPHGEVTRAYEVFDEAKGSPRRSSYVVDKEGVIRWSLHHETGIARDLDDHVQQLQKYA